MTKSLFDQVQKHLESKTTNRSWWYFERVARQEISSISYEHNVNKKSYSQLKSEYCNGNN